MTNTFIDAAAEGHSAAAIEAPSEVSYESLAFLGDVTLSVMAELDRRTISVRELLKVEPNHLLMLSRPAGENIEVFAGDVLIASAEILASEERLAIRIADLFGQAGAI